MTDQAKDMMTWAEKYFKTDENPDRCKISFSINYADFIFQSNKDALLMSIHWNGRIVSDNELTSQFVGSMLQ